MTDSPDNITLNEAARRFEWQVQGRMARIDFTRFDGGIAYEHTVVPKALEGRGIGSALARHALDYAAKHGLKVRPDCSFVRAYIDRHPQYRPISLAHDAGA
ncbi:MAG: N-acetyltransferase [Burkholderiaceae bacterium]|jgi:predicted GNAT family acetyltransferase|nr:N-acetyltransferase [Burkholderiaceae bacterium]